MVRNNTPPVVEEIIIEHQTIEELREELKALKNELKEKEEENEELDKLVWKGIEKLKNERDEKKSLREENKKKDREITNLKQEKEQIQQELDKRIKELEEERKKSSGERDKELAELKTKNKENYKNHQEKVKGGEEVENPRNWESFYNWLTDTFLENPGQEGIKKEHKDTFKNISDIFDFESCLYTLLRYLEHSLDKKVNLYDDDDNLTFFGDKILPYKENENLSFFFWKYLQVNEEKR